MTPQEIVSMTTIVISAVLTVAGFLIGRQTAKHGEGREAGALASDLGYVKSGIDDIKRKQEQQEAKEEERHLEMVGRMTAVEESSKQAHKRIDRLEKESK